MHPRHSPVFTLNENQSQMHLWCSYLDTWHYLVCKINPSIIQLIYAILLNFNFSHYFSQKQKSGDLIVFYFALGKKLIRNFHINFKVKVMRRRNVNSLSISFYVSTKLCLLITFLPIITDNKDYTFPVCYAM